MSRIPRHILDDSAFTPEYLEDFFARTSDMLTSFRSTGYYTRQGRLRNKRYYILFYERSFRTISNCQEAGNELGMRVIWTDQAGEFSTTKGESVEHTVSIMCKRGASAIAIRHPEEGASARAAVHSSAAIINAGDGKGSHPTQRLIDEFTIRRARRTMERMNVTIAGDLARGRTARSLMRGLSRHPGIHFTLLSDAKLRMGQDVIDDATRAGATYEETEDIAFAMSRADVFYQTRTQHERAEEGDGLTFTPEELARFNVTPEVMRLAKPSMILMHPGPISKVQKEISDEVLYSGDPRVVYFDQASYGPAIHTTLLLDVIPHD